jgi:hypothetical protein
MVFCLSYRPHGGSGINASLTEVLDLASSDRDWFLERLGRQRREEAAAIKKGQKE